MILQMPTLRLRQNNHLKAKSKETDTSKRHLNRSTYLEFQRKNNKHEYDRILGAVSRTHLPYAVKTTLEGRHNKLREFYYSSTDYQDSLDVGTDKTSFKTTRR